MPSPSPESSTDSLVSTHHRPSTSQQQSPQEQDHGHQSLHHAAPLIRISYKRMIRNYTLVPVSALVTLASFASLLFFAWPHRPHSDFIGPLREFLVAAAAWTAAYSMRQPIFAACTLCWGHTNILTLAAATVLQTVVEESVRLGVLLLLGIRLRYSDAHRDWVPRPDPQQDAFAQVWWVALGWASVEVAAGIAQTYEQLALYKDVLVESDLEEDDDYDRFRILSERTPLTAPRGATRYLAVGISPSGSSPMRAEPTSRTQTAFDDPSSYLEDELAQLIAIKTRAEIEDVYGIPVPNIPVFVSVLQRIDAIILSLGISLCLGAALLRALTAHPLPSNHFPPIANTRAAIVDTLPTLAIIVTVHAVLSIVWAVFLPRIGVPSASYGALLVALGLFFVGLASWDAI